MRPHVNALIGNGAIISADGSINVVAAHNYTSGGGFIDKKAQADTFAPGGGLVSGKFTTNESRSTASTDARVGSGAVLDAGLNVTISSRANNVAEANGRNISGGVISVSTVNSTADARGSSTAALEGDVTAGGSLIMVAQANSDAEAAAASTNGSLLGGVGSTATALASPTITAFIDEGLTVNVGGAISISSVSTGDAGAEANGTQGGVAGLGIVNADAFVSPIIATFIGQDAIISAGSGVTVSSQHNAAGGRSARATATAPGGGIISGNGADPDATANAQVDTYIAAGATIDAGGTVMINSISGNVATATADTLVIGGVLGIGTSDPDATATGNTRAHLEGSILNGGGLSMLARTTNAATASGAAVAGGILAGVGSSATATVTPTLTAYVAGGQTVNVTGSVSISSESTGSGTASARGTTAGLAGFGISSANVNVSPDIDTYIGSEAQITAGGGISLSSSHNSTGAIATASAPGFGILTGSGADPNATANANVDTYVASGATLDAGGAISLSSGATNIATADANVLNIGVVGIGISDADASSLGTTRARMDGTVAHGGSLSVQTTTNNSADADADASGGGIAAIQGASAVATVDPTIVARVTGSVNVTGSLQVLSTATSDADADTFGFSLGLLVGGTNNSTASITPDIDTFIGNVPVHAGSVLIQALHNIDSGGSARARAEGTSGGLVGLRFINADAISQADVHAYVQSSATIDATGSITINARSRNDVDAQSIVAAFGLAGVGTADADAVSGGTVKAFLDGDVLNGTNLSLFGQGTGNANAYAEAAAGGLVGGTAVTADATVNPNISTYINTGASVNVSGNVSVTSDSQANTDANASGSAGGLLGLAATFATSTISPTVATFIGVTSVTAGGGIALQTTHNYSGTSANIANNARATSTAAGGGLIGLIGTRANANSNANVQTTVSGGASLNAGGDVVVTSRSFNDAFASGDGDVGGLVAVGEVEANASATGLTTARVNAVSALNTTGPGDDLIVTAVGTSNANASADASTGGLVDVREPRATATAAPNVQAFVSGSTPMSIGGSVDIKAVALGDVSATADGTGGGLVSVGTSAATANWTPIITAQIGGGATQINAQDDVRVQAFNNFSEGGAVQNARRVRSDATASGGGLASIQGASAITNIDSFVEASIGAGAHVSSGNAAGDDLEVIAKSRNNGEAQARGVSGGLFSQGSSFARTTIRNDALAFTADSSTGDRTQLAGGGTIKIHAESDYRTDTRATGEGGGLIGLGGSEAISEILSPVTKARLGNNAIVTSDSATFEVSAENRANMFSKTNQNTAAAIANNAARSTTRISNGQTLAEIGSGSTVHVDRVIVSAREVSINATAESDAIVPFDIAGSNHATSVVDIQLRPLAHVFGPGTDIKACEGVDIIAGYDQVRTTSDSFARTFGITGVVIATSQNDKRVDVDVIVDSGVHITTNNLVVNAYKNNEADDVDYLKRATAQGDTVVNYVLKAVGTVTETVCTVIGEIVCAWGLICDPEEVCEDIVTTVFDWVAEILGATVETHKPGVENVSNDVVFNADVTLGCSSPNPTLDITADALIDVNSGFRVLDQSGNLFDRRPDGERRSRDRRRPGPGFHQRQHADPGPRRFDLRPLQHRVRRRARSGHDQQPFGQAPADRLPGAV